MDGLPHGQEHGDDSIDIADCLPDLRDQIAAGAAEIFSERLRRVDAETTTRSTPTTTRRSQTNLHPRHQLRRRADLLRQASLQTDQEDIDQE